MKYRRLGQTGVEISALGMGGGLTASVMLERDGASFVDEDKVIPVLHRAFELGVNYIDTAAGYSSGQSELVIGRALQGWRDRVYVSTKLGPTALKKPGDYRRILEGSLHRLNVDYVDLHHFHSVGRDDWQNVHKTDALTEAAKAKEQGLIRHLSFSVRDDGLMMKDLIDLGVFETVLCGEYHPLARGLEDTICYAHRKGVGVIIFGGVGAAAQSKRTGLLQPLLPGRAASIPQFSLRYVLSNLSVACVLTQTFNIEHLEQNIATASRDDLFCETQLAAINAALEARQE